MVAGKQAGKKRPHEDTDETSDFFAWFDADNEDEDFIGTPMKEIWEEPVKVRVGWCVCKCVERMIQGIGKEQIPDVRCHRIQCGIIVG